jgi:uncharacterized protein
MPDLAEHPADPADRYADPADLADRYAAVFNEPDPAARRAQIAALWSQEAQMYTATAGYTGATAIEARVAAAHQTYVAGQGYLFRPLGPAQAHHDGVRIRWEMVPAAGGPAASTGVQFLLMDQSGLVRHDHQFLD